MNEIVLQQPMPAPKLPPRYSHNRAQLDKFLVTHGIKSQWPAVTDQLPTTVISGLFAGGYNPSIIRYQGKLVMVYRFHPDHTAATKLAIAELDEKFNVIENQELDLREDDSCEDARLFIWKGELWMLFVVSTWPNFPASTMKIAKLTKPDHWRASDKDEPWIPDRQTMEKNWVPLPEGDDLHIIYNQAQVQDGDPSKLAQVVFTPAHRREMKTPALRWPYGEIRGGTVPLPYKGKFLKFFHSSLRNEMPAIRWRYYAGAMLLKGGREYHMISISKRPILRGSEIGGDPTRHHFKPNVIFPLGAIEHEDGWLISAGINDSQCALIKVSEKDLNF